MRNYQFTLTFRSDVNSIIADRLLNSWLRTGTQGKIDYLIFPEIGRNLRYHYHGYFQYEDSYEPLVLKMLFRWKHMNGFVKKSEGTLSRWIRYISKDITIFKKHRYFTNLDKSLVEQMIQVSHIVNNKPETEGQIDLAGEGSALPPPCKKN